MTELRAKVEQLKTNNEYKLRLKKINAEEKTKEVEAVREGWGVCVCANGAFGPRVSRWRRNSSRR